MFEAQCANFPRTLRGSLEGILKIHVAILGLQNCGDAPECTRLSHGASRSHCEWSVLAKDAHELRTHGIPHARFNAMAPLHSIALAFRCATNASIAALIVGCELHAATSSSNSSSVPGSTELTHLYNADQVERAGPNFFKNAYASREAMLAQIARDSTRLVRVRTLINDGRARTAADFFHAAIVAQHGADTTAYRQAAEWAVHAVMLDSTDVSAK